MATAIDIYGAHYAPTDRDLTRLVRVSLAIPVGEDGGPPSEFRIFAAGVTKTTRGDYLFDEEAAKLVMAAAADWGNDFPVDYDHSMVSFFGGAHAIAAAWFAPEIRDGELWATAVQWTNRAREYMANREYRYFSPSFEIDQESGVPYRIVELVNVALTNLPATKNMTPLVAHRTPKELSMPEVKQSDDPKSLLDKLRAMLGMSTSATATEVDAATTATVMLVTCPACGTEVSTAYCPDDGTKMSKESDSKDADAAVASAREAEAVKLVREQVEKEVAGKLEAMAREKAEADAKLAKAEADTLARDVTAKLSAYKALAVNHEKDVPVFLALLAKAPTEFKRVEEILAAANAAITAGVLLEEKGRPGDGPEQEPMAKLYRMAADHQKANPTITKEQAFTHVAFNTAEGKKLLNESRGGK